jgi:hypothetical protein
MRGVKVMTIQLSNDSAVQRHQWVDRGPDADGDVATATEHAEPHTSTPAASPAALSQLLGLAPREPNGQRAPWGRDAEPGPRQSPPSASRSTIPGRHFIGAGIAQPARAIAPVQIPQPFAGGWFKLVGNALQAQAGLRHAALTPSRGQQGGPGWLRSLGTFSSRLQAIIAKLQAPPSTPPAAAAASDDAAALEQATTAMHQRFAAQASNKEAFDELLHQAFGDKFDAAKAETIRQQTLAGDFSWAPKVQVVSSQALADLSGTQAAGSAQGAYVQSSDTIYLSRELLNSDPAQAERILMEEMGHGIDARINTSDAVGDEGEIFSRLMHGDKISAPEMAALKADNDHGVVNINGRNVTVEYGWLSKAFKAVTGGISKVVSSVARGAVNLAKSAVTVATGLATGDFHKVKEGFKQGISAVKTTVMAVHHAIVDTAKELHRIAKHAFQKLMQSKIFAAVLMVCRFIPIPIVQLVVRIIDVVRAAYMVYQGIKNHSIGAVLGGVASLAGGAANLAGSLGASAATVSTISTVAGAASKLSMAYSAIANKDIGAAIGLIGGAVGGPGASAEMNTLATAGAYAQQAVGIAQAVRSHDALAALGGVVGMAAGASDKDSTLRENLGRAQEVVTGLSAVREISRGNLDAAQSLAMGMNGAQQARRQADAVSAQRADESREAEAANNRGLLNAADQELRSAPAAADDQRNGSDVDSDNTAARNGGLGPAGSQTVLTVGKGQTLEGIARAQYGENWRAGLAQVAQDNGLKLNQWGSPILLQGQNLVLNDLGNKSDDDLDRLARTGGRIIANNDRGLQAKADLEERARQAAAVKLQEADRFSTGNDSSAGGVCTPDNPRGLSQSQLQAEALAQMGRPTSVLDSLRPATGPVGSAEWFRTASEAELHRNGYQTVKAWDPAADRAAQEQARYQANTIGLWAGGVLGLPGAAARSMGAPEPVVEAVTQLAVDAGLLTVGGAFKSQTIRPASVPEGWLTNSAYANELRGFAGDVEPRVTSSLQATAEEVGGKMIGLDARLKTVDSLSRKLDNNPDLAINDALRYTMTFDAPVFTVGVRDAMNTMTQEGYKLVRMTNTFEEGASYKGINATYKTNDGQFFELQFHTPESFAMKQDVNHGLYEQQRVLPRSDPQWRALDQQMIENSRAVPVPPGAETIKKQKP